MHFSRRLSFSITFISLCSLLLTGCPQVKKISPPPISVPPTKPTLEKTFGEATFGGLSTLLIRYKSIGLLIDPVFEGPGRLGASAVSLTGMKTNGFMERTKSPGLSADHAANIDYLLLTDLAPHHFGKQAKEGLRKNIKIIATPEASASLQAMGFTQTKGLSKGQRILLKKENEFLFVSVVQSRNAVSEQMVNGYLLEFDNGRNIFISGEIVDEPTMREFLYGLRDDGKEIDLAFIYGGGLKKKEGSGWESCNEESAASFIGLLQPHLAVMTQADSLDVAKTDPGLLRERLKDEIFSGEVYFPTAGETLSF